MNTILRSFFYSVGMVLIFWLYVTSPDKVQFSDLARLVQNEMVQQFVGLLTVIQLAISLIFGGPGEFLSSRRQSMKKDSIAAASAKGCAASYPTNP